MAPDVTAAPVEGGAEPASQPFVADFEADAPGGSPSGFTTALSGKGAAGRWEVLEVESSPSGRHVVAQLDGDPTSYRFPLLVLDSVVARDIELAVSGYAVSGTKDQAVGIVWRYRDQDNYYVLRANALEGNVVAYKMEAGERSDLDLLGQRGTYGLDVPVPPRSWNRLGVRVVGSRFTAILDGRELFEVEDTTFPDAGQVGLWTKADSVTWFDDLEVRVLDAPEHGAAEPGAEEPGAEEPERSEG
jgi:hypothetical protein